MMSHRAAFVSALANRPDDEAARLVFADWLEEQGDAPRAELIRIEMQAAHATPGSRERAELLDRAEDLLVEHERAWLGDWARRLEDWEFKHGLLHRVRLSASTFEQIGEELLSYEPVVVVEFTDAYDISELISHRAFRLVRNCTIVPCGRYRDEQTPVSDWLQSLA